MSAYVMPNVKVATNVVQHVSNTAISRSPLSGAVQRKVRDGEHLTIQMGYQNLNAAPRRLFMSWASRLNGAEHQAIIRDEAYEKPSGTLSAVSELLSTHVAANLTNAESWLSVFDVSEGVRLRRKGNDSNGSNVHQEPTTFVAGQSYVVKNAVISNTGSQGWGQGAYVVSDDGSTIIATSGAVDFESGVYIAAFTAPETTQRIGLADNADSGRTSSEYVWQQASCSRCLLVDNGFNALDYSEQFDNVSWSKVNSSVTANAIAAPDGSTTADALVEDSSAGSTHYMVNAYTRTSVAEFWTGTIYIKENTQQRLRLGVHSINNSSDGAAAFFDANTGAVTSTISAAGTASLPFASIHDAGDGWYRCRVTVLLPASSYVHLIAFLCDGASNTTVFNGDGSSSIYVWGAQLQRGGQLGRYTETIAAGTTGTDQTGKEVWVKGLNNSENQQMLAGDQVEINGQLFFLADDLDGDESGCGLAVVTTSIRTSPADEDAVILYRPHGTFLLENPKNGWSNSPGIFSNSSLNFVEDITA